MGIGAPELMWILVIIVVLFGSAKLPKLARSLGQASKEFKKGARESDDEPDEKPTPAPAAGDEKVTMTKAELDALLAKRDAEARRDAPPSS